MNKYSSSNFTLVEIALAMGVITVGLVSILGLFPVGTNASRDAIGQTYAAQTADMFLQNIENEIRSNWSYYKNIEEEKATESYSWDEDIDEENRWNEIRKNIYKIKDDLYDRGYRVYRIRSSTEIEGSDVNDFDGIIRVWHNQVSVGGNTIPYENAIALHCEISWPAPAPYDKRKKELFYLELFRR